MSKINSRVIVSNYGNYQLGVICDVSRKKNRRVFDVMLETGSTIKYVPVDSKSRDVYIDSNLTKKIVPQIVSNLNIERKGNVRI